MAFKKLNNDISIATVHSFHDVEGIGSSIEYVDLDTSITIKSEKFNKVFYNNVDNPLVIKDYKKLKNCIRKNECKVHVCSFNVGAARIPSLFF